MRDAVERMHDGGAGLNDGNSLDDVHLSSETSTLDHLCLRIDPFDKQKLLDYLEGEDVDIVVAGDSRLGADGIGPSVYVRDPEGNVIELKGSPHNQDSDEKKRDNNLQGSELEKTSDRNDEI